MNKKIAIISFGFQGSSSSLVEALLREGHEVDFYQKNCGKSLINL